MDIRICTEPLSAGTYVVTVAGHIDLHTASTFEQELQNVLQRPFELLLIDLTDCGFLDSTALHILFRAHKSLDPPEHRMALIIPSPKLLMMFEITGLDRALTIHPDRATALNGSANTSNSAPSSPDAVLCASRDRSTARDMQTSSSDR